MQMESAFAVWFIGMHIYLKGSFGKRVGFNFNANLLAGSDPVKTVVFRIIGINGNIIKSIIFFIINISRSIYIDGTILGIVKAPVTVAVKSNIPRNVSADICLSLYCSTNIKKTDRP